MAKKIATPAPAAPVVHRTPEENLTILVDRLKAQLENPALQETREKFAKGIETGDLSYAICWYGYDALLAEALERRLIELRFKFAMILAKNVSVVLTLRDWLREVQKGCADEMMKPYRVEWDSSTSPLSNQRSKAESHAFQVVYERAGYALNAIEFLMENAPEFR